MAGVEDDLYAFSVMILAGVGLGLSFDVYQAGRRLVRVRGLLSFLLDLGYGLGAGAWLAGWLVVANWGQLRWYAFAGVLLGVWTYAYLGSPLVRHILRATGRALRRLGRRLARLVTRPQPPAG
ncbi:MAG: spore cortex biosynthesis protein YabQ [Bacillota bacterium]|nr:spore cortex biosynthesis protein YabQ [Bacillota bacterium]